MSANGRISNDKNKGRIKCDLILRISYKHPPGRESVEGVLGRGVSLRFSPLHPDHYKFVDFLTYLIKGIIYIVTCQLRGAVLVQNFSRISFKNFGRTTPKCCRSPHSFKSLLKAFCPKRHLF